MRGVRIKIASAAAELDELFQVRHRVFVEQMGYFPPAEDGRLLDRFDAFPTTANIVALHEGRVVGGVRIVEPSPTGAGAPTDALFDFRPHLPEGAVSGSGSMLVMEEAFRAVPRVTFAMLGMMYYWALCKGLTHITGVAAPHAVELFLGSGYKAVAQPVLHPPSRLPRLPRDARHRRAQRPLHRLRRQAELPPLPPQLRARVPRAGRDHHPPRRSGHGRLRDHRGQGRRLRGGRPVQPDVAHDGVLRQPPSSRAGAVPVRELGPGDVFGELALITSNPRSADVVALTDVDLMVLEREAFHRQISQNPEVALNLLSVIGNRLMSVTDRLSELRERDA